MFDVRLAQPAQVDISTTKTQLSSLASRQHGAISLQQLLGTGVSRSLLATRCGTGEWVRIGKTVFAMAGSPDTVWRQLWIAYLSKDACLVSGRSAAAVHRLSGASHPVFPEITIPYSGDGRSSIARITRSQFFNAVSSIVVEGLEVSSVPETIFMVAQWLGPRRTTRLVDDLLIREPRAIAELEQIFVRYQGHRMRGMATMRPIIAERAGLTYSPTESELEAVAWDLFIDAGIPNLWRQSPLPWAPAAGRVDLFVPAWGLIIELDGRRWHTKTEDFERDRSRDNAATASGYAVMRFTWDALTKEPKKCLSLVHEFGSRAAAAPISTNVHQPSLYS